MYIHIGNNFVAREEEIIGIFDLESTTISKRTRYFLKKNEKDGKIENIAFDIPKSFIVCSKEKNKNKIYLSQVSSATLFKRYENIENIKIKRRKK